MIFSKLGRTELLVSRIAFGAGPVAGLMTGDDRNAQREAVLAAVENNVNWFDTAPGYGEGKSETNLGRVLNELGCRRAVHVSTKVRLLPDQLANIHDAVRQSLMLSVARLGSPIRLLQLHNGITARRGSEPFSLSPSDVLGSGGVFESMRELVADGLVHSIGLTGTGDPAALREVIRSGGFDTIQTPFNLLNQSAVTPGLIAPDDPDYGGIVQDCAEKNMGVFAIRVFAGGALLDQEPSAHTLKTPFFPLAQYQRDRVRAVSIGIPRTERAIRFVLEEPRIHCAIIGFAHAEQVRAIGELLRNGLIAAITPHQS